MYGKLFASMFTGSLHGHWQAIITFQQMIILADQDGTIEMTPSAISSTTSIPLDIIEAGITILEAPDPDSRTPGEEGRRITRINPNRSWGWHITNHAHYRSIRTAMERREYHKQYWHKRKTQQNSTNSTTTQPNQPIAEAEAEAEALKPTHMGKETFPPCPKQAIIDAYHQILPTARKIRVWNTTREGHLKARWREYPDIELWNQLFLIVSRSKFLTGRTNGTQDRPPFMADLGWILKPNNFAKIIEGNYDDKKK